MTEDIEHAYLKEKMHYQHDSGLYETELRAYGRDGQSGRWGRVGGQPAKRMRFGLRGLTEFMALRLIRPSPFSQSLGLP